MDKYAPDVRSPRRERTAMIKAAGYGLILDTMELFGYLLIFHCFCSFLFF